MLILSIVIACTLVTAGSFFQYEKLWVSFEDQCFDPVNHTVVENCTQIINGSFTGLSHENWSHLRSLLESNLYPR